jgi:hypothetical protein
MCARAYKQFLTILCQWQQLRLPTASKDALENKTKRKGMLTAQRDAFLRTYNYLFTLTFTTASVHV